MTEKPSGLRERTRRAVQKEIADAAAALFFERGYEATTIDDIAAAVGLSQRSVFRYFASKEELILGKFDFAGEEMVETLRSRPAGESPWVSLRRMFDLFAPGEDDPGMRSLVESILRVVFETPALFASYLEKQQRLQEAVVEVIIARAAATVTPYAADDPAPRALTAAAFGCLVAAQHAWLAAGARDSFTATLDRAMAAVGPAKAS